VTTDPEEIDTLLRRVAVRRRLALVAARSIAHALALSICGYLFGWGLQHDAVAVSVMAAFAAAFVLVAYWITWLLSD
jgi:hypothetical protein